MDLPTPDIATDTATSLLSRIFLKCLLRALSAALPSDGSAVNPDVAAETWDAARELFFAMQPRNPIEAAIAARAVAAHFACMDMYARAARPGTTDEKALRLRSSAATSSRSFDTALKTLEKRQARPAAEDAPPAPERPAVARRQPRVADLEAAAFAEAQAAIAEEAQPGSVSNAGSRPGG